MTMVVIVGGGGGLTRRDAEYLIGVIDLTERVRCQLIIGN